MTLLDKFRTQPRDKHPDAAVRLSYVEEIPLGERDAIAAIAKDDEDPRVRKAAVSKLMDPAALGADCARRQRRRRARRGAIAMLRDIALDAFEGISETDSLDAVDAIADPKLLAQIAKSAAREDVALKALARFSSSSGGDAHALGSIARHAAVEAARRGAFDLLRDRQDRGEILAVG